MKRFLLFLLIFLFIPTQVFADDPVMDPQLKGVWRGTIGKQEVMVCFDDTLSSYYYLRYFWGIALFKLTEDEWKEHAFVKDRGINPDNPTGYWKFDPVMGENLNGQWSDAERKRTEPVQLTRVKSATKEKEAGGCDHWGINASKAAFNAPRVEAQKISRGEIQTFEDKRYRVLSTLYNQEAVAVKSVELLESGNKTDLVNQALQERFKEVIQGYFECQIGLDAFGPWSRKKIEPDFSSSIELKFWNKRWISLYASEWNFCGGAHPNLGIEYLTFDFANGKKINLWNWFKEDFFDNEEFVKHIDSEFVEKKIHKRAVLIAKNQGDDERYISLNSLSEKDKYRLSLSKKGMVFYFIPTWNGAGVLAIEIPYPDLLPFLTDEGKAAVKSIMAENAKK